MVEKPTPVDLGTSRTALDLRIHAIFGGHELDVDFDSAFVIFGRDGTKILATAGAFLHGCGVLLHFSTGVGEFVVVGLQAFAFRTFARFRCLVQRRQRSGQTGVARSLASVFLQHL